MSKDGWRNQLPIVTTVLCQKSGVRELVSKCRECGYKGAIDSHYVYCNYEPTTVTYTKKKVK